MAHENKSGGVNFIFLDNVDQLTVWLSDGNGVENQPVEGGKYFYLTTARHPFYVSMFEEYVFKQIHKNITFNFLTEKHSPNMYFLNDYNLYCSHIRLKEYAMISETSFLKIRISSKFFNHLPITEFFCRNYRYLVVEQYTFCKGKLSINPCNPSEPIHVIPLLIL